ncbi:MAG: hypothetical protein M3Y09_14715, partial [Actinomycetota bacterium]|nr:hypothetical protein [Actinomycetota bacterium]
SRPRLATHRGQCSIASHGILTRIDKPQHPQLRYDTHEPTAGETPGRVSPVASLDEVDDCDPNTGARPFSWNGWLATDPGIGGHFVTAGGVPSFKGALLNRAL